MTRFRDRLLVHLLLLLAVVLGCNFLLVRVVNLENARRTIDEDLHSAAEVFDRVLRLRLDKLRLGARLMSDDWAFRRLYGGTEDFSDPLQRRTLVSGLENYRTRMRDAAFLQLVSPDDELLADTMETGQTAPGPFAFPMLLRAAEEADDYTAARFEAQPDGSLALLVAVPLLLPEPSGWIVAGFLADDQLAANFRGMTGVEVSFVAETAAGPQLVASSLEPGLRAEMREALDAAGSGARGLFDLSVSDDDTWISTWATLPGGGQARGLLQQSLSRELAPFQRLEATLQWLTLAALLVSALLAVWLALGISRPVAELARGVRRIAEGRYDEPVVVGARDEMGQLASAFNGMARGLQERDRVRDLLGKNVSPEVAAELMRRPAALGGEEKDVTIMFTDVRGFTGLSEASVPADLLATLNGYFTELTRVIEAHGGIVDKYIGDAVMAVFGAPVETSDHARSAVACAAEIRRVLRAYNAARAEAGQARLDTGMGLASGKVVAGNMGSAARYNYTVIGDTVNLAARLQDETKAFKVDCVIAGSTAARCGHPEWLRPLGEVTVRGKTEAVGVFTLRDGAA
ncbi:MAG: adenylate/guanylate cyclase domain-containing protein [Chthoniobacterales bacterium]|nr:adenylate/guanylate cyclase domain-containing protein [Chthoniobacterales bacterium]